MLEHDVLRPSVGVVLHSWISLCRQRPSSSFYVRHILDQLLSGVHTTMGKQTFVHHVLAYTLMYLSLWTYDFTTVFGIVMLFMEFSTLFSNARWVMF